MGRFRRGGKIGWKFTRGRWPAFFGAAAFAAVWLAGCAGGQPTVVLYSDLDQSVVEPLLASFRQDNPIVVKVVYADPKMVASGAGLSDQIRDESEAPQADLYWAGGPQAAQKLAELGLLEASRNTFTSPTAAPFVDESFFWTGLGGRVRVLIYNTARFKGKKPPISLAASGLPEWKGRAAWADPRKNADSNYHLLNYFAAYGPDDGTHLLEKFKANAVQLLPDENAVIEAVSSGAADWGVTDSDLATAAVTAKKTVDYLVPDQADFSTSDALSQIRGVGFPTLGTVALPMPLCLIARRKHSQESGKLQQYLLAPQTALHLAQDHPTLLMTRAGMQNDKPGKDAGHLTHPDKLRFTAPGTDKLKEMRAQLTLALSHIFGDAP